MAAPPITAAASAAKIGARDCAVRPIVKITTGVASSAAPMAAMVAISTTFAVEVAWSF